MKHTRREFLAGLAVAPALVAEAAEQPVIIDTHTHFYDPTRPEGVPWPGKDDKLLYRKVLPDEFQKLVKLHGVTGTIVVEASPWPKDNDWLLKLAKSEPIIKGIVGRLFPGKAEFANELNRLKKEPLFRGIRISSGELKAGLENEAFRKDLGRFAEAELTLDVNGGPEMLTDVARLAKDFPKLRIVVNHMANVAIDGKAPPEKWKGDILACGKQTNVWCKMSALVEGSRMSDGKAPKELAFYSPALDVLWEAFGVHRLVFGSNWPVSDAFATYATVFKLADEFLAAKGKEARAKIFGANAVEAYGLKPPG